GRGGRLLIGGARLLVGQVGARLHQRAVGGRRGWRGGRAERRGVGRRGEGHGLRRGGGGRRRAFRVVRQGTVGLDREDEHRARVGGPAVRIAVGRAGHQGVELRGRARHPGGRRGHGVVHVLVGDRHRV